VDASARRREAGAAQVLDDFGVQLGGAHGDLLGQQPFGRL
jgi:hypothetical protein